MPPQVAHVDPLAALRSLDATLRASLDGSDRVALARLPPDARTLLRTVHGAGVTLTAADWSRIHDRLEAACLQARTLAPPRTHVPATEGVSPIDLLVAIAASATPATAQSRATTHLFSGDGTRARLRVLSDGAVLLTLQTRAGARGRARLIEVDGTLRGVVTIEGTPLAVELRRPNGGLSIQSGLLPRELKLVSPSRDALERLLDDVRETAIERRLHAIEADSSLTAAQKAAARAVRTVAEGPNGYTFSFLRDVAAHAELDERDAQAAPLLYAWATSVGGNHERSRDSLRDNLARCRLNLSGEAAEIIDSALAAERAIERPYRAWLTLGAGLFGARSALLEPDAPQSMARIRGWERALSLYRDPGNDPGQFADVWRQAVGEIAAALPAGSAARPPLLAALAGWHEVASVREAEEVLTPLALALGEAMHILRTGEPPRLGFASYGEPMPLLCLESITGGVRVEALAGPLGAEHPSWQDVQQGQVGDCYFASAWIGVAKTRPEVVTRAITRTEVTTPDSGQRPLYRVDLHVSDASGVPRPFQYWVDGRVYVRDDGSPLYGATRGGPAAWFPIVEKAFAYLRKRSASYGSIGLGFATDVMKLIFGKHAKTWMLENDPPSRVLEILELACAKRLPVTCTTQSDWKQLTTSALSAGHCYAIDGLAREGGRVFVELVNPHPIAPASRTLYQDVHLGAFASARERSERGKPGGKVRLPLEQFVRDVVSVDWIDLPPP